MAALAWADFLESHAQRIYHAGAAGTVDGAHAIIRGLRGGKLDLPFTVRDVIRKNWSPLGEDAGKVRQALDLLEDHGWVRSISTALSLSSSSAGSSSSSSSWRLIWEAPERR